VHPRPTHPRSPQRSRLVPGRTRREGEHRPRAHQPLRVRQDHPLGRRARSPRRGLNISIDYLLIDGVPRRPLHAPEHALGDQFARVGELDDADIASLPHMLDALVAKKRLKTIAGDLA
jgi:hypothetical protein